MVVAPGPVFLLLALVELVESPVLAVALLQVVSVRAVLIVVPRMIVARARVVEAGFPLTVAFVPVVVIIRGS